MKTSPAVIHYMSEARRFAGEARELNDLARVMVHAGCPDDPFVQARYRARRNSVSCLLLARLCRAHDASMKMT
jgi:hypothetical protein